MTRCCRFAGCLVVAVALVATSSRAVSAADKAVNGGGDVKVIQAANGNILTISTDRTFIPGNLDQPVADNANQPQVSTWTDESPTARVGCATPAVIYQNIITDAGGQGVPLNGGWMADDITLAGNQRLLCSYSISTRPFNGVVANYNVNVELTTACPTPVGTGTTIAGTQGVFTNIAGGAVPNVLTVNLATPIVLTQNTLFIKVTSPVGNTQQFTWRLMGAAEVGTSADVFAMFDPGNAANNNCNWFFGGTPFAAFRAELNADVGPGACCLATGVCVSGPNATECAAGGGVYQGDGSDCANVTCNGACCAPDGSCALDGPTNCANIGGIYRGTGSVCLPNPGGVTCFANQCTVDPNFPSLGCQLNDNEDGINGNFTNFRPAEDFRPTQNSITKICVFGIYTIANPLPTSHFRLTYRANNNGLPGAALPGGTFEEGVTPGFTVLGPAGTGQTLTPPNNAFQVFSWTLTHPSVAVTPNQCMWVEVTNQASAGTWFWVTAGAAQGNDYFAVDGLNTAAPNGYTAADISATANVNLAFCINNAASTQQLDLTNIGLCATGSCCLNDCPFTCVGGQTQAQCTALSAGATWTPGGDCSQNCFTNAIECCRADMNGDGKYNGLDVQLFARAIAPLNNLVCVGNEITFCRANMNEDTRLNANDIPGFVQAMLNSGNETNDRCCGAQLVVLGAPSTTIPTTVQIDNTNATSLPTDPSLPCSTATNGRGTNSVWLKFVANATSALVDTEGSVAPADDSILGVYEGTCENLVQLGCDDDGGTGFLSRACVTGLTIGNTYLIQLASFDPATVGNYTVNITSPCPDTVPTLCCLDTGCQTISVIDCNTAGGVPTVGQDCSVACPNPINDSCTNPTAMSCGGVVVFDNTNATTNATDPALPCFFGNPASQGTGSVWGVLTLASAQSQVVIETSVNSGPADTQLAVYTGTCGSLTQIACSEDIDEPNGNFLSRVTLTNLAAGTYLVEMTTFSEADRGAYNVTVTCTP